MAHGNFHSELVLNPDGKVIAGGPLRLEPNEEIKEIYAWIVQDLPGDGDPARCDGEGEGMSSFRNDAETDAAGRKLGSWSAPKEVTLKQGQFQLGDATAMALAICLRGDSVWTSYWWEQTV